MKKICCVILCSIATLNAVAQSNTTDIHFRMEGVWQNDKDSTDILAITVDSVAMHKMQLTRENLFALEMSRPNSSIHTFTIRDSDSIPKNATKAVYNADSIDAEIARLKLDPRCSYDIVNKARYSDMGTAATGKYLLERYKDKVVCYSIAEVSYSSLKLISRDGTKADYHIMASLFH